MSRDKRAARGLSDRIREQRQTLGLTQEEFGEGCGVGRRAQAAYESGERVPNADYLLRAVDLGVDLKYLLTGVRSLGIEQERLALEWLFRELCRRLEIPPEASESAIAAAASIDTVRSDLSKTELIAQWTGSLLGRSKRLMRHELYMTIDRDMLTDAIREQERAWARAGKRPSPIHKSHRFSALYEAAIETGKLNLDLIEDGSKEPPT